jgi:membrane protein
MQVKSIISLLKTSLYHWQNHRASRMGAALSYYTIFSIIPLLMLALVVIGPFLGHSYIKTEIVEQVRTFINTQSADFIQSILNELSKIKFNFFTILVSIVTLVVGVVGVFYELKNSLDDLWETSRLGKEAKGWRHFFSSRLLSLSIIPILGFLLIISLIFSTLLSLISEYSPVLANMVFLFQIITFIFSFFVLGSLFTFIYHFLPKRKLPWRELVRGAFVTTVLFMLGKFIIGIYIAKFAGASLFGAAGAFAIFLIWVYCSVQIFLFGASLTYVYSKRYGHLKNI